MALAVTVAGCANKAQLFEDNNEGGWFSKPANFLSVPEWARPVSHSTAELGPQGAVAPEDLVNPDGTCAPAAAQASPPPPLPPPPPTPAANGAPAGDAASIPLGAPVPGAAGADGAPAVGGIALGMSECEAVRRAGAPSNVAISSAQGERKAVITYLGGSLPGIYTFTAGRLKVIDAVPEPEKPKKPEKKKKTPKRAKTAKTAAQAPTNRVNVQ